MLLSVAVIVKLDVPVAVGVPLMTPALLKLRPAGKMPVVTAYVYGLAPPLVLRDTEYALPTVPAVNAPATGTATNVGGLIVIVAVAGLDVPQAFDAVY